MDKDNKENDVKNQFEFLIFDGILRNKIYSINLKLRSFILNINDNNFIQILDKSIKNEFYLYILNNFFSEAKYNKLLSCLKDLVLDDDIVSNINIDKYEKNIELYYDIMNNIINIIFPFVPKLYSFENYIKKIIFPNIYNPFIKGIPNNISYHEIIIGGNLKLLLNLLLKAKNYKEIFNLKNEEEEKLKQYLFSQIILNNYNKRIFNKENYSNNTISIT